MAKTDNLPPKWQGIVMQAIKDSYNRQAQDTTILSDEAVLKEAYRLMIAEFKKAGTSEEDVPLWIHGYLSRVMHKVLAYAVSYSNKNPATHRKGYGDAFEEKIAMPTILIFRFSGEKDDDDWQDGPGDEFPDPEPAPDDDWDGPIFWTPMMPNRIDVARRIRDEYPEDWAAMRDHRDLTYTRRVAWALYQEDSNWGLNGKRGNPNDLSLDVLAYLNPTADNGPNPGIEAVDFISDAGGRGANVVWNNITRPVSAGGSGGIWVKPEPLD